MIDENLINFVKIVSNSYFNEETISLFIKSKNECLLFDCAFHHILISSRKVMEDIPWTFFIPIDMKEIQILLNDYKEMDINLFVLTHGRNPFRKILDSINDFSKIMDIDILEEMQVYRP